MSLYAPALAALEARRTAESPPSPQRRTKATRKRQSSAPQPLDTTTPSGRPLPY